MELHEFMHLHGRHDFPRDHRAIDDLLREALGHLRHGHADRGRAQSLQGFAGEAGGIAQLQALQVIHGADLLVGMNEPGIMRPEGKELHLLGFFHKALFGEFSRRAGIHDSAIGRDEGQFEHFSRGEAAGVLPGRVQTISATPSRA